MIDCTNYKSGKKPTIGICAIGLFGGRPHQTVCTRCEFKNLELTDGRVKAALAAEKLAIERIVVTGATLPASRAIPRDQWPLAVRVLAKLAITTDRGVGDVLARLLAKLPGDAGVAKMKAIYKRLTGRDCRCMDRQSRLNAGFPL